MTTRVRLTTPGNAILDGLSGVLLSDKPGPGFVLDRGDRYRILVDGHRPFEVRALREEFVRDEPTELLREISGRALRFTGNSCPKCGGSNVTRTGTCETCLDCGESLGGCS